MKTDVPGLPKWEGMTYEERGRRMKAAEALWRAMPRSYSWEDLEPIGRKFAALTYDMVREEGDPEATTFVCHVCRDHGYTLDDRIDARGPHGVRAPYTAAVPCDSCRCGIAIEASHWTNLLQPEKNPADATKERYRRRQRSHPKGLQLRTAVESILGQQQPAKPERTRKDLE